MESNPSETRSAQPAPPTMGVLNFNLDLATIINNITVMAAGLQSNQPDTPKVMTSSGQFLLVTDIRGCPDRHAEDDVAPGTVVETGDGKVLVKTVTETVQLSVVELDGRAVHPRKYGTYGLNPGARLRNFCCPTVDSEEGILASEDFWKTELERYVPTLFTRQKLSTPIHAAIDSGDIH
ncbi:hypothetical protein BaRGS_00003854 [Batillaria attramentaria]|uniref:Uncharacterized protein n=1 Tax=Batillaria attramentaria TaxID=370345 RepID=A0ABD0M0H8_9CAEN